MQIRVLITAVILACAPVAATALEPLRSGSTVAFLGLHFIDTSTEGAYNGIRDDETKRLDLLLDLIETRFQEKGFEFLDLAPVQPDIDAIVNPANCYGCEIRIGAKLGADYVVVGEVQKVSNLILSMNLVMKDVASKTAVRARSVEIRSNTDATWLRGMRYILKTHFFKEN